MGQDWHLEFLGRVQAVRAERTITRFRTQRGLLVLAILATQPQRAHAREALGEQLWPDEDPQRQRLRLRGELSELRSTFGEELFVSQGHQTIRLRQGITCDVVEFERHVLLAVRSSTVEQRLVHLEAAAQLYQGELLPGSYDDWAIAERQRLQEAAVDIFSRLLVDLPQVGRADQAQILSRELAGRFPEESFPEPSIALAPVAMQDYVGRDEALAIVRNWAQSGPGRVLTITGPGGMGKTRLSRESLPTATFVPLADATDADGFWAALHTALALPKGGEPLHTQVTSALQQALQPLLILDNFEQLVAQGAPLVAGLLDDCPRLRCLVTSRRSLGIHGEQEYRLEPLGQEPSVALFLARARQARPDFAMTPAAQETVAEIALLLEGLPLAIELAAARSVLLGPRQILSQLSGRLRFLVSARRTDSERHRSLRAALDWSIHLLSPELKRVFARLSVFHGGWTLDAAEQVCAVCGVPVVDALEELHNHSLIRVRFDADESARYEMLTVVQEYATELLDELGEKEEARAAHAKALAVVSGQIAEAYKQQGNTAILASLLPEIGNLNQGIDWAVANERYDLLYDWLSQLGGKLFELGYWDEFVRLMDAVDGHMTDDQALMRLCSLRGALLRRQGKEDSASLYWNRWLALAEQFEDAIGIRSALYNLAGQCLDRKQLDDARYYLDHLSRIAPLTHYTRMLEYRYRALSGDTTVAKEQAIELLQELADSPDNHDSQVLKMYLIDVLAQVEQWRELLVWGRQVLPSIYESNNPFHVAYTLGSMVKGLAALGYRCEAYCALALASELHTKHGTRQASTIRRDLEEFLRREEIAPEWGQLTQGEMWHTLLHFQPS